MSIQLFFLDKLLRFTVKRRFARNPDVMTLRAVMEDMAKQAKPAPAPVVTETIDLGGVAAEKLSVPGADARKAILYIHGGGFVAGVPANHRPLTWRLAAQTNIPVYVVDYRLAPEHVFRPGWTIACAPIALCWRTESRRKRSPLAGIRRAEI